ncbi:MAG: carboxypeptidase-like regulatory domain-containing protein [Coriobacteriales bacterium]|jgi:hypothetical protein|nr:carboxypeptidase-like regulatory domain-containing protein [Coriobacteriales bacterium]
METIEDKEMNDTTIHTPEIVLSRRSFTQLDDCASVVLIVRVWCPQFCDLTGTTVLIQDSAGEEWEVELTAFNGVENETDEFTVKTGSAAGSYSWTATYLDAAEGKASHAEVSSSLAVDYYPHALSLAVWDVTSPVASGEIVTAKAGAKCNNDCPLTETILNLYDAQGEHLASAALGSEPWAKSRALYWTEFAFQAPTETGIYTYRVRNDNVENHRPAQIEFSFLVAPKPDCTLSVTLSDKESKEPIPSATVSFHPYRARTDEEGHALLQALTGQGKLSVSAVGYQHQQIDLVVTGDTTLSLMLEPKPAYEEDF